MTPPRPPELSAAARALLERRAAAAPFDEPRREDDRLEAPLSFSQFGHWAFASLYPGDPSFNLPKRLYLRGDVDPAALAAALTDVTDRHRILRTAFSAGSDEPVQRVQARREVPLPVVDLRGQPAARVEAVLDHEARQPFHLDQGHLMRPRLVRTGEQEWILQVTFHHIVFDGWSTGVFLDELAACYTARRAGRPADRDPLPLHYEDYAAWQCRWEATAGFEASARFWRRYLAGRTSVIGLPTDRPDGEPATAVGTVRTQLDPATTRLLRAAGGSASTTLGTACLAGFAVLLGRRCEESSVIVGQVTAGRTHVGFEPLIGTFVNLLPVAAEIRPGIPFAELVRQVQQEILLIERHAGYPFDRLSPLLRPVAAPVVSRVYDALFNFRNFPFRRPRFDGCDLIRVEAPRFSAGFGLSLDISPHEDGLSLELDYDAAAMRSDTAERWLNGYQALLRVAAAAPGTDIHRLPLMSDAEAAAVVDAGTGPRVAWPGPDLIHQAIELQARTQPEAPAIWWRGDTISYAELDGWADSIADQLRAAGAGPESIIGVLGHRDPGTIAALLGTWKAEAAFLPLDPVHPPDRLALMAREAGCAVIVTSGETIELPDWQGRWLAAGRAPRGAGPAPARPAPAGDPARLAYLMYTSGSTGAPKGVMVEHGNLRNFLRSSAARHRLRPGSVSLWFASLGFDSSIEEIFAPLVAGGAVAVGDRDQLLDPVRCVALMEAARVSFAALTPTVATTLDPGRVPALEDLVIMGEAGGAEIYRRWPARTTVWNGYGPTECTIGVAHLEITDATPHVTIGHPIENTRIDILDQLGQRVPFDTPGEIVIAGECVARGYLADSSGDQDPFGPDPFVPGGRRYRTGDRGRMRPGLGVEFLGRRDRQVKIRGQRIELAEIEAAMAAVAGVIEPVAFVRAGAGGDQIHACYRGSVEPERVMAELQRRLPPAWLPAGVVPLAQYPLTPSGKLDVASIPAAVVDDQPPEGPTELALAEEWQAVLPDLAPGRHTSFLAAGGHSLLAMRLVARIERRFGLRVGLADFFRNPTIAGLADKLTSQEPGPGTTAPGHVPHGSAGGPTPIDRRTYRRR